MAVTRGATITSYNPSGYQSSATFSHTFDSGTDGVLIVAIRQSGTSSLPSSVTFDGVSLTRYDYYQYPSRSIAVDLWRLVGVSPKTANVVVTASVSAVFTITAVNYYGVNQTTPLVNSGKQNNNGASDPSVTSVSTTTTTANTYIIGAAVSESNVSPASFSGASLLNDVSDSNSLRKLYFDNPEATTGSKTVTMTCNGYKPSCMIVASLVAQPSLGYLPQQHMLAIAGGLM